MQKLFLTSRIAMTVVLLLFLGANHGFAQISPGELARVHSHLEGMANCTQCHTLGAKVSNDKCLACHKEIKARLDLAKGFHASSKVRGKDCTVCHSDHYGLNFDILHLQKDKFDHNDTGYRLEGKHSGKDCKDCHTAKNIAESELRKKKETYLGLNTLCITCHEDVHVKTLSPNCQNCHTGDAFKPASKFVHSNAKFALNGKHTEVPCLKCHPVTVKNGRNFQHFTGIQFVGCVSCHKDPHENKFGQNCSQCHGEVSFKTIKQIGQFDHNKTGYPLQGRHLQVNCKSCHKNGITAQVRHEKCIDCHKDYHKNQFAERKSGSDCSDCHDVEGFNHFSFTIDQHNQLSFQLQGSHLATPCFDCHKKGKEWSFRSIGTKCVDCHKDPHLKLINEKYYPEGKCENCHKVFGWSEICFDHRSTDFTLEGKHAVQSCRKCHFREQTTGLMVQKFGDLKKTCETCHKDVHQGQFREGDQNDCRRCHGFENWKAERFDHNATRFKLDGGHKDLACILCHKVVTERGTQFIHYKIKELSCASCHLQ